MQNKYDRNKAGNWTENEGISQHAICLELFHLEILRRGQHENEK